MAEICLYTQNYLRGVPSEDWQKEDGEIKADPNREYSFVRLVEILQERLIPNHIREVEVSGKWRAVKQKPDQSVAELIDFLELLPPTEDERKRTPLLHAIHLTGKTH